MRDDFGNWFGNDNSNPLWHYPLEERYVRRNPHVTYPGPRAAVVADKDPTKLYPISRLLERFNNPESANRVTSACGPTVYRDELLFAAQSGVEHAFFCEPVHNLVRHLLLLMNGRVLSGVSGYLRRAYPANADTMQYEVSWVNGFFGAGRWGRMDSSFVPAVRRYYDPGRRQFEFESSISPPVGAPMKLASMFAISILLAMVALAASFVPSRRAMALNPVDALRHE